MIAIAESGSTKTDWYLYDFQEKKGINLKSQGINPYFSDVDLLHQDLRKNFNSIAYKKITEVFFYGPGCSLEKMRQKQKEQLKGFFSDAEISINSDLLAAGRSLFNKNYGIACILGTGSNSGMYNGSDITYSPPSLGYIFGDEGGGSQIGKMFLMDFLNNEVPIEINQAFITEYNIGIKDILDNVYSKPYPNRYLAAFTKFIQKHISHAYCKELVKRCFESFFNNHILKYPDYHNLQLKFTGSVAHVFQNILIEVASEKGISINLNTDIVKNPLQGLINYHLQD